MKTAVAASLFILFFGLAFAADPTPPAAGSEPIMLSLRDAVAQALERNLDLAVARIAPQSDAQDVTVSESAFDSRFEASARYAEQTQEPSSGFSSTGSTNISGQARFVDPLQYGAEYALSFNYGEMESEYPPLRELQFGLLPNVYEGALTLNYSQSLLRNFGVEINRTAIEQALLSQRISEDQLRTRIFDIVENVETSYWTLIGAQRQLEVAQKSLELAQEFLKQTRIKVEVGILAPIEITAAEAEVAAREEAVLTRENVLRDAEDVLRALLRVEEASPDWDRPIQPTDQPGFQPIQVDVAKAIDTALARRSELATAQLSIRTAELNQRWRDNQVRPDLSLNAAYTLTGNNYEYRTLLLDVDGDGTPTEVSFAEDEGRDAVLSEIPTADNNNWSVGALFSIPIRNRAAKAEQVKARLAVEQTQLQFEQVKQQIRVEVRAAARQVDTNIRRVETTRATVALQRKKLDAEQKRYDNGLSTAFQVLTYQKDLRDAESQEVNAIVDFNRAMTHLSRVQGLLLEERGVEMAE